ncbi:acetolactate synthase small subunit [Synergistaceae bacterium OttesenSCG-928-D05]|nr:acetolactate synthase small subunit [Synergistaceae bacterium OttesenSCG-928-D05]
MRSTFSITSEDNPGVLMRIASLIYRRGYNIASMSVGRTHKKGISRFTVVVEGGEGDYEQVRKQLKKLVEVIEVRSLSQEGPFVERWLSLVKVNAPLEMRPHVLQTAEIFRCRVIDLGADAITLEITGDHGKLNACIEAFKPYGIIEIAGSGSVALSRSGFITENMEK